MRQRSIKRPPGVEEMQRQEQQLPQSAGLEARLIDLSQAVSQPEALAALVREAREEIGVLESSDGRPNLKLVVDGREIGQLGGRFADPPEIAVAPKTKLEELGPDPENAGRDEVVVGSRA